MHDSGGESRVDALTGWPGIHENCTVGPNGGRAKQQYGMRPSLWYYGRRCEVNDNRGKGGAPSVRIHS